MISRCIHAGILSAFLAMCLCAIAAASPPSSATVSDQFAYTDGPLATRPSWEGSASTDIYVTNQRVRITGGGGVRNAFRLLSTASTGLIWVHFVVQTGAGAGETMWSLWLNDPYSNNLARVYGMANTCRGRVGGTGSVTDTYNLTPGIWNDIDVRIDTAVDTCEFFCNRVYMGKLNYGGTPVETLSRVEFERIGNDGATNHTIYIDDLQIGAQPPGPPCDLPAAPTITSPAEGEAVSIQTPTILWTGGAHDAYEVHVNSVNSPTSGTVWDSGEVTSTANQCTTGTLNQGSYFAFVRIKNPAGWSPWSAARGFLEGVPATIIPTPQQCVWKIGTSFTVGPETKIVMNDNDDPKDLFIARQLRRKVWDMTGYLPAIVKGSAGAPTENVIAIGSTSQNASVASIMATWPEAINRPAKTEGYMLGIKDNSIVIAGFDQKGAFYGSQTLILLLEQYSADPIDGLFCYDYPDCAWRGSFYRQWEDPDWDFVKEVLSEVFARYKLNVIEPSFSLASESHPEIPMTTATLDKTAVLDCVSFAEQHFMEVVAMMACSNGSEGGATYDTMNPDLREDRDAPDPSPTSEDLCERNPRAMQILHDLWDEMIDLLHPRYAQIGHSEYTSLGDASCPLCHGVPKNDLLIEFLTNDANYLTAKGVTPMIWGDMLRSDMPAGASWGTWQCVDRVPDSYIIQDWDYSTKTDFPSLLTWKNNGLTSLGAPYGLGLYGYVGRENIYNWAKSCKTYGNQGLVAFNKFRPVTKHGTLTDINNLTNLGCFPFYAEWSWTAERPYWNPLPFNGEQMILDRMSPDRPSGFSATKVGNDVQLSWTNPPEAKFQGAYICYRPDTYPTEPIDGVFVADVTGSANGTGAFTHTSVPMGGTIYYSAFSHDGVRHFSARSSAYVTNGTPLSLTDLRTIADGKTVNVAQAIVTAAYNGFFYVENEERTCGMRVDSNEHMNEGDVLTVVGTLGRTNAERSLSALWVGKTDTHSPPVRPFAIRLSSLGAAAPGNVGLLVKMVGELSASDPSGTFFHVNDGSAPGGIKIDLTQTKQPIAIPTGDYFAVTGICSLDAQGRPVVRPRSQSDLVVLR